MPQQRRQPDDIAGILREVTTGEGVPQFCERKMGSSDRRDFGFGHLAATALSVDFSASRRGAR